MLGEFPSYEDEGLREERFASLLSLMNELRQIGPVPEDPSWGETFVAEVNSYEWFRILVMAVRCHCVSEREFLWLDAQAVQRHHHARWGWKFRRMRNHPEWGREVLKCLVKRNDAGEVIL